jgi:hypothetical protein
MPRRLQRALEQLTAVTTHWAVQATRAHDEHNAAMWRSLATIASNQHDPITDDVRRERPLRLPLGNDGLI